MAVITSTTTGNWNSGATWVGGTAPGAGDSAVIAAGHVVTVTANQTVGDLTTAITINATGQVIVNDAVTLTLDGDVILAGTMTQNDGSTVTFNGNHDIAYSGDTGVWDINGTASNRATLQAAATFGFSIQDGGSGNLCKFYSDYGIIDNWGRSDDPAHHAIYIRSNGKASKIELTNTLAKNYWRFRFAAGFSPSAAATYKWTNCDFRSPKMTAGNKYAQEYSCTVAHNENTRGFWDCTFAGTSIQNIVFFGNSAKLWTYPFVVSNCVSEDILWYNYTSAYVELDVLCTHRLYTTSGGMLILFSNYNNGTHGLGGWRVFDTIADSNSIANAHSISNGGGDNNTPDTEGVFEDNISICGAATEDNNFLYDGGDCTWQRNVSIGGSGFVTTEAVGTGHIKIRQHTHINLTGAADSLQIIESSIFPGNIDIDSSLIVGVLGAGGEGLIENLNIPTQTIYRTGYNCLYNTSGTYINVSITNDLTANDITDNPNLNNAAWNLAVFDAANGGPGTVANAFAEFMKLNGIDRSGSTATFDSNYTKANALAAGRAAFTPTNSALQGAGYLGVDIGALAVSVSAGLSLTATSITAPSLTATSITAESI